MKHFDVVWHQQKRVCLRLRRIFHVDRKSIDAPAANGRRRSYTYTHAQMSWMLRAYTRKYMALLSVVCNSHPFLVTFSEHSVHFAMDYIIAPSVHVPFFPFRTMPNAITSNWNRSPVAMLNHKSIKSSALAWAISHVSTCRVEYDWPCETHDNTHVHCRPIKLNLKLSDHSIEWNTHCSGCEMKGKNQLAEGGTILQIKCSGARRWNNIFKSSAFVRRTTRHLV